MTKMDAWENEILPLQPVDEGNVAKKHIIRGCAWYIDMFSPDNFHPNLWLLGVKDTKIPNGIVVRTSPYKSKEER